MCLSDKCTSDAMYSKEFVINTKSRAFADFVALSRLSNPGD